jgi:prepilin-type N-terminal cleavage/methylation domain-containing protein
MKSDHGFTLIEIIITITLTAIGAALFVAYLGTSFTQSPASSGMVTRQYALIQQMELITVKYRNDINSGSFTLSGFETYIGTLPKYIPGTQSGVDDGNTGRRTLTYGSTTTQEFMQVTLTDGGQTLVSLFTQ